MRAFDPAGGVGKDVFAGAFKMRVVANERVVIRALPEMPVLRFPAAVPCSGRPRFLDAGFEVPNEVGDGGGGACMRIGAKHDDRVKVIGHDDVGIDGNAVCIRMERAQGAVNEAPGVVEMHACDGDGAAERLAMVCTDRDMRPARRAIVMSAVPQRLPGWALRHGMALTPR